MEQENPMITSKLPNVGTTIFTVMSQLAAETGAINLSQGFPISPAPTHCARLFAATPWTAITNTRRWPGCRPCVSSCREDRPLYGRQVDMNTEVTITPGATHGIFCAIQTVVRAGDEVIVFDPSYDSYEPSVELAGGRCVHVQLKDGDFSIDWEKFSAALSPAYSHGHHQHPTQSQWRADHPHRAGSTGGLDP